MVNLHLRVLFAFVIVAALLLIVAAVLFVTESALSVREQLQNISPWSFYAYLGVLLSLTVAAGWTVWRLLVPKATTKEKPQALPSEEDIDARLENALDAGMDVEHVVAELAQLRERRTAGEIYIAVFGDISAGKSSLIRALLPDVNVAVAASGGTTQTIDRYVWDSPAGDHLYLVDMPGINEPERGLDTLSREEAMRAHVVVYVCEGDLTRSQFQELQALLNLNKPVVVAVNKTDRYTEDELKLVLDRLRERLVPWPKVDIVLIRAGSSRQVLRINTDGTEQRVEQAVKPQVKPLQDVLQRVIDDDMNALEKLRDAAVFVLAGQKLDAAERSHRQQNAKDIVQQYTRKAVMGALAAVSPGTDVIIQGYLGVNLIKELSELYETPVREIDAQHLLKLIEAQSGKTLPLMLALAGNALKAFPGVGTVTGGLAHAVAYGLIFDALGRAVSRTLDSRGALHPGAAASLFKESLGENLETRARRMVELAKSVQQAKKREP